MAGDELQLTNRQCWTGLAIIVVLTAVALWLKP